MMEETDTATVDIQHDSAIEQFRMVTGATQGTAKNILEACNWNLELAINMHVDSNEMNDIPPSAAATAAAASSNSAFVPNQGSSSRSDDPELADFVRAPIPPVRQVLIEDDYNPAMYRPRRQPSAFDAFRDFQAEASWQEQMQLTDSNGEDETSLARRNKRKTLQEMYRPPLDMMFRGSLEAAKEEGTKKNKWLLVNVQNMTEFPCQVLNRDVWSNNTVKDIIQEHFVFWQIYHDSADGERYCQFYNVNTFPQIAVLDPRTGEKMVSWGALDAVVFCENITEFISEHPTPDGTAAPPQASGSQGKNRKVELASSVYEQSEEEQLKAAIAASLQEAKAQKSGAIVIQDITDDDSDVEIDDEEFGPAVTSKDGSKPLTPSLSKAAVKLETWQDFLGQETEKLSQLVIRFPDGKREQKSFPSDSRLKTLLLYVSSHGYNMDEYELVTNFPRRNLNSLSMTDSLSDVGLFPRETVYVQQKASDD